MCGTVHYNFQFNCDMVCTISGCYTTQEIDDVKLKQSEKKTLMVFLFEREQQELNSSSSPSKRMVVQSLHPFINFLKLVLQL